MTLDDVRQSPVNISKANGPLVLAFPHCGTRIPEDIWSRLNLLGKTLGDTDWHVDRLYEGLLDSATCIRANFHRYVIDVNRDPDGHSLYPGQNTTDLVPLTNFDGQPIWKDGQHPAPDEIKKRIQEFHLPYHKALAAQLQRVRQINGIAILYDCHSIRSTIPFLFEGQLPDFNIGTNNGITCANIMEVAVLEICKQMENYATVINGRFKGGWTTRHYANPDEGIHTIQMELSQATHLKQEHPPFDLDEMKANALRKPLKIILERLETIATTIATSRKGWQ